MRQPPARDQHVSVNKGFDDGLVCVALSTLIRKDSLTSEPRSLVRESEIFVDGGRDSGVDATFFELARVRCPDFEVVTAVTGRSMYEPRAVSISNMVSGK
jgi:hypothetical protein